MPNLNKRKGTNFEGRFLAKLIRDGHSIKGGRFYASKGVTDIWWVDKKGVHNEAQLKFSTKKKPWISEKELEELHRFGRRFQGLIKVWLVKKQSRKPLSMEAIN